GSTLPTSEQIETIRTLKGKVPKYRIIRDFHINENRVKDIWESHEFNIDHASSADNLTKKISEDTMNGDIFNTDIVTQIEREIKRKDKNL
ncbi:9695_t:CDS:2, partial [Diversispora eburnea]